jgi:hypothetical protein
MFNNTKKQITPVNKNTLVLRTLVNAMLNLILLTARVNAVQWVDGY